MNNSNIELKVTDSVTFVSGKMDKDLYQEFKRTLGYFDSTAIWKKRGKNWDGYISTVCFNKSYCKCPIKKDGIHFPTGLYSRAVDFFKAYGRTVSTIDNRSSYQVGQLNITKSSALQTRDYQEDIIEKACKQQRGIIKAATGSGKTAIGSGIIAKLGVAPFIFYVTSQDLLVQAKSELERFLLNSGQPMKVGVIGGSKCEIRDINIMTVQTAVRSLGEKYEKFDDEESDEEDDISIKENRYAVISDLVRSAKGIIADECHHWSAKTCQIISDYSINARFKFGLSGTPWRDEGDDMLIDACFGKLIAEINASFLIRKGILVQPQIYFVHNSLQMEKNIPYQTAYKQGIVENEKRNGIIANIAQKMKDNGRNTLILVKHIEHGSTLEQMIPGAVFLKGKDSSKTRQAHIEQMRQKKIPITIATSIFDEGVDVKPLDGLILAGSGKSQTRALQRIGRVIRTYEDPISGFVKKDAYIVDFQDNFIYMNNHSNRRRNIYRTEPEFIIREFK